MTPTRMILPILILTSAVLSAQDPLARVEQETAKVTPAVTEIRHQHPSEPRAVEPRGENGGAHRRLPAQARPRSADRRRAARRRRAAERRPPRTGRGGSRRHRRVAGHRADQPAVRVEGPVDVPGTGRRRDARVRTRRAHGRAAGRRDRADGDEGGPPRHGEVHLPARRGRAAARGGRRRVAHGEGRRPPKPPAAGDLRPARVFGNGGGGHRVLGRSGALGGRHLGGEDRRTAVARRQARAVHRSHRRGGRIRPGAADHPIAHLLRTRARRRDDRHDSRRPAPQHHPRRSDDDRARFAPSGPR